MLRHSIRLLTALVVCGGCVSGRLGAEEPFTSPAKVTNAALVYWQAFALLPQLSEDDTKLLSQIEKDAKPLEEAVPFLASSSEALQLTRNVKRDTPCRWELIEDGPNTQLPHLSKARLLARLLVLQAKVDANAGNSAVAVDHLSRAFLIARNVDEGVLVQMLVGGSIESLAIDAAHTLLKSSDGSSLDQFAKALSNLPTRTTFGQAISYERDLNAEWLRPIMTSDIETAREKLKQAGFLDDSFDLAAILSGTKENRTQRFEEMLAAYDQIIKAAKLPRPKAEQEFGRLAESFEESPNPLTRMLEAVFAANKPHAQIDARFTELEMAVREAAKSAGKNN